MPAEEVQRYATLHELLEIVNRSAIEIFTLQSVATAPLTGTDKGSLLTVTETDTLIHEIAVTEVRLELLEQVIEELDHEYAANLRK